MNLSNLLFIVGAFIPALGIIVFIHEFGHFAVAKAFGMRVFIFSLGFGRRLLGFKWGDTDCRVSLVPLGGYVKLEGEPDDPFSGDPALETRALDDGTLVAVENPDYFTNRPRWQRILVYLAGPVMNAALTIGVLTVFYMIGFGVDASLYDRPIVGAVEPGSPAEAAGIQPGDEILSIDGRAVENWEGARYAILIRPDAAFDVRLRRGSAERAVAVRSTSVVEDGKFQVGKLGVSPLVRLEKVDADSPAARAGLRSDDGILSIDGKPIRTFDDIPPVVTGSQGRALRVRFYRDGVMQELVVTPALIDGSYRFGVRGPKLVLKHFGFARAVKEASLWSWNATLQTFETIARLVTGRLSFRSMAGPIGIARAAGDAAREGADRWFLLVAIISLQVGILNLLPIAPLDGGHLAILCLEGVRRRDLSERAKAWIMNAGFGVLLLLIVLVFYSDLSKTSLLGKYLP